MRLPPMREPLSRAWRFLTQGIWDVEPSSLPRLPGLGVRAVRVVQLVYRGFYEDECPLHASALTFSTLMSLVPVAALSLALVRGLGDEDTAKARIRAWVSDWTGSFGVVPTNTLWSAALPQMPAGTAPSRAVAGTDTNRLVVARNELAAQIDRVVESGFEKVDRVSFRALGGMGLALLIWMSIQVLGGIEAAFNRVWGVTVGRSVWRCFTDYLSVLVILPVLALAASSMPVADFVSHFVAPHRAASLRALVDSDTLRLATAVGMTTASFTFLFVFMPNTRVRLHAALSGGLVAALLFLGWLKLCAALQVGVARYSAIYGGFALVPIILAWVYMSWQIALFGAEVAFAVQNCGTYQMEQGAHRANVRSRVLLALSIVLDAARAQQGSGKPLDAAAFARDRRVPVRLVNEVVELLVAAGYLAQLSEDRRGYVLLRSPESLPVADVAGAVLDAGLGPERLGLAHLDPLATKLFERVCGRLADGAGGATMADALRQA